MGLSDYERQMLEELEAQLASEDPSLLKTMRPEEPAAPQPRPTLSIRNLVLGLLIFFAGIGVLLGGVTLDQVWLGGIGVIVMFLGAWYVTAGCSGAPRTKKNDGGAARGGRGSGGSGGPGRGGSGHGGFGNGGGGRGGRSAGGSFMDRQAEKWERRRDGHQ